MTRPYPPARDVPPPLSRAAIGRSRLPILIALGLAIAARMAFPPAAETESLAGSAFTQLGDLPARAEQPPMARPTLPSGVALQVIRPTLAVPPSFGDG